MRFDRFRQCRQEVLDGEGAVESHLDHAHLLSPGHHMLDGLVRGLRARAHDDDDPFGIGSAHVVEEVVLAAGMGGNLVHGFLDDARNGQIVLVDGLPALEIDVGVLAGTTDGGPVGTHGTLVVPQYLLLVHHVPDGLVVDEFQLLHLVRGPETVEEVDEGHPRLQGGHAPHQGQIVSLLHRAGAKEGKTGLAHSHDVLMVAEDAEGLSGQRAGAHMPAGGRQLTGDLVHVGDHEHEPLAGCESGTQRAALQGAVHGCSGPGLGLHLGDERHHSPDVPLTLRRPGVAMLRHGAGGSDGVDRDDPVELIGDARDRFVAVHHGGPSGHLHPSSGGQTRPRRRRPPRPAPSVSYRENRRILNHPMGSDGTRPERQAGQPERQTGGRSVKRAAARAWWDLPRA